MTIDELKRISEQCPTDAQFLAHAEVRPNASVHCNVYNIDVGPDEIWRSLPKHQDYEVSNYGRLRSNKVKKYPSRLLKPKVLRGYMRIMLWEAIPPHRFCISLHRAVLEVFVGPCPPGMECCHKDGNKQNNHVSNLRWDTRSENVQDCIRRGQTIGRPRYGEDNGYAKLRRVDIPVIREMHASGLHTQKEISLRFGVSEAAIQKVVVRRNWGYVA